MASIIAVSAPGIGRIMDGRSPAEVLDALKRDPQLSAAGHTFATRVHAKSGGSANNSLGRFVAPIPEGSPHIAAPFLECSRAASTTMRCSDVQHSLVGLGRVVRFHARGRSPRTRLGWCFSRSRGCWLCPGILTQARWRVGDCPAALIIREGACHFVFSLAQIAAITPDWPRASLGTSP